MLTLNNNNNNNNNNYYYYVFAYVRVSGKFSFYTLNIITFPDSIYTITANLCGLLFRYAYVACGLLHRSLVSWQACLNLNWI